MDDAFYIRLPFAVLYKFFVANEAGNWAVHAFQRDYWLVRKRTSSNRTRNFDQLSFMELRLRH